MLNNATFVARFGETRCNAYFHAREARSFESMSNIEENSTNFETDFNLTAKIYFTVGQFHMHATAPIII